MMIFIYFRNKKKREGKTDIFRGNYESNNVENKNL